MILKFDNPIHINKAKELYNNNVKLVTSTDDYPNVTAIEFSVDPKHIFKRKIVAPRVTKKSNKIIDKYNKKINTIWSNAFKSIVDSIKHLNKQESIFIGDDERQAAFDVIAHIKEEFGKEADTRFREAFKLGKLRGQVLSNQEVDDDLTDEDERLIEEKLDANEVYLAAFSKDLQKDLDKVLTEKPYETFDELETAIKEKVEEPKKARASMYSMAILGLVAVGMVKALMEADEESGERVVKGGYWTVHPEEGKGGEICQGCLENSGKFFTISEFEKEYQSNNCLTRCRCDLDTV